ncbi:hypothetical protein [Stenotrophomonas bentonitica]|uniref:hypothetical protein n=1 Tax=Stenotrophomonas bentonitica TaxID=1450134 RepID=UPI00345EB562
MDIDQVPTGIERVTDLVNPFIAIDWTTDRPDEGIFSKKREGALRIGVWTNRPPMRSALLVKAIPSHKINAG